MVHWKNGRYCVVKFDNVYSVADIYNHTSCGLEYNGQLQGNESDFYLGANVIYMLGMMGSSIYPDSLNSQINEGIAIMKKQWSHVDTCLPDYWQGHTLPYVQIPVWHGMTLRAVKDSIRDEIHRGDIGGRNDDARLLSADMVRPGEEKQADALTRSAYAAVNKMRLANSRKRRLFTDLEDSAEDDCGGSVYAYFILVDDED